MKLKLATWNVGSLKRDYSANIQILSEVLAQYRPDVLFMQEFVCDGQLQQAVCDACGLQLRHFRDFSPSHIARGERMGVAVFCGKAVRETGVYSLVKPDRAFYYKGAKEYFHDKYFMSLALDDAKDVVFLTGHGFSFNRYGENPANFPEVFNPLDKWLSLQKSAVTVAIGDFNTEDAATLLPQTCGNLTDVFCGVETRPNGRKTDYMFLPKEAEFGDIVNLRRGRYDPDEGFDHNYLQATVNLPV
ncbi:MAG: endonuclease/exonuclease/phosphatase family protein [Corallococcus sp.]|nr:endonuclease/exonuclease/phosphatase family protein [Corallococcus sp.]